jgi:glycosyltransferase involved in cell wall biosynthesis
VLTDAPKRKRCMGPAFRVNPVARVLDLLTGFLTYILYHLDMEFHFAKIGREFKADIYTSNDLDTLLAGVLCTYPSRKLVYDAHELWADMNVGMGYSSLLIAFFRIIERILIKKTDSVITVNEFLAEELRKQYRLSVTPYVILNLPHTNFVEFRKHQPHGRKTALYQGGFIANRGLENVIRACEFLNDDVQLVLRGFGAIEDELRRIAKPFRNCRFDPPLPLDELVSAASAADVGIVTYLPINLNNYLASPNKLFEYIQAGIPIVASNLPFIQKIVKENDLGILFDPSKPKEIALAINQATEEERLRTLKANVMKVRHLYSWEREQRKLIAIYEQYSSISK